MTPTRLSLAAALLLLGSCSTTDWSSVGRGLTPDELSVAHGWAWGTIDPSTGRPRDYDQETTSVVVGLTWYLGPRETTSSEVADLRTLPVELDDEADPDLPMDENVHAFTDPKTGEVWIRPGFLFSSAGLALVAGALALYRRLHRPDPLSEPEEAPFE
jgi:hypothetical protein